MLLHKWRDNLTNPKFAGLEWIESKVARHINTTGAIC